MSRSDADLARALEKIDATLSALDANFREVHRKLASIEDELQRLDAVAGLIAHEILPGPDHEPS